MPDISLDVMASPQIGRTNTTKESIGIFSPAGRLSH